MVTELYGAQEDVVRSNEALKLICRYRPKMQIIVHTFMGEGVALQRLVDIPQLSLISRRCSVSKTLQLFDVTLRGEKVTSSIMHCNINWLSGARLAETRVKLS